MSAIITLFAIVGFLVLLPTLLTLAAGVFYWLLYVLLKTATLIIRGATGQEVAS